MLFPTVSFAVFLAIVLPLSWYLVPRRTWWRLFMVAASWTFYGFAGWGFVPLLVASTIVNHAFAFFIDRSEGNSRRRLVWAAVAVNLSTLGWFKYVGFLSSSASSLLDHLGLGVHLPLPKVLLPAGISFFTFQALSYVIDIYRRRVRPVSLLDFAVYLSFFPHLLSGPIVRASEFLPQIRRRMDRWRVDASRALWLIALGLFKKVVIASYMATQAADPLFGSPHRHGGIEALFGIYAYAIQIYADFSGYTDIAIGLALLFGIRFPQNFDDPYRSRSLQEFWRRWHMTLSRWLRDYLYIPLGGNRLGNRRTYINLMATMVLGGLWHGAAWTFVAWGALHGAGLAAGRLRTAHRARRMLERRSATAPAPGAGLARPGLAAGAVATNGHDATQAAGATDAAGAAGATDAAGAARVAGAGPPAGYHRRPPEPQPLAEVEPPPSPGLLGVTKPSERMAPAGAPPGLARWRDQLDRLEDRWSGRLSVPAPIRSALAVVFTFNFVCLGWVFFRATSFGNAMEVLGRPFSRGQAALDPMVVMVVLASLGAQFLPTRWGALMVARFSRARILTQAAAVGLTLVVIDVWGPAGVAPFIYFRF